MNHARNTAQKFLSNFLFINFSLPLFVSSSSFYFLGVPYWEVGQVEMNNVYIVQITLCPPSNSLESKAASIFVLKVIHLQI